MHNRLDAAVSLLAGISRAMANELVYSGQVRVNGVTTLKPGIRISESDIVEYHMPKTVFVSRGGYKLQAALEGFRIELSGRICLDVGASTGGFTDCMLYYGAALVHALDVGTAQLHQKLRADERVLFVENTNVLSVIAGSLKPLPDFAALDVSFVSASKVLPHVACLLSENTAQIVVLVKPQFECGRFGRNKRGVVRDNKLREAAVKTVVKSGEEAGLCLCGVIESPIKGGDGNSEYLALFKRSTNEEDWNNH